jgi:hypothetical protein
LSFVVFCAPSKDAGVSKLLVSLVPAQDGVIACPT